MKKNFKFAAMCASALLWVSCSQNNFSPVDDNGNDGQDVNVNFAIQASQSPLNRSMGEPESNDATNKIARIEIYVIKDGKVERKAEATSASSAIDLKLTKGPKRFYAVANATNSNIKTESDLLNVTEMLSNSQAIPFTMISKPMDYTISESDEGKTFTMTVARLVSRISLKYKTDFTDKTDELVVDSIYLMKANSMIKYDGTVNTAVNGGWLNNNSPYYAKFLSDIGLWSSTPVPFEGNKSFNYYVYPNEKPALLRDATSIVISGKYRKDNSSSWERTYYRVDVNVKKDNNNITYGDGTEAHQYVRSNTIYNIKATIKGVGTEKPTDNPVNVSFWVKAADWNYVEQAEEF